MQFNWDDGPFELFMNDTVHTDIKFKHDSYTSVTTVQDATGKYLTSVFTSSGDANGPTSAHYRKTYVRKAVIAIEAMSDEDLVAALRKAQTDLHSMHLEINKRGYSVYDEDGTLWSDGEQDLEPKDFIKYGKFVKTITTEKVL